MGHDNDAMTISDAAGAAVALLGLPGFRVLGVVEDEDEQTVWLETLRSRAWCHSCGARATSKGRPRTAAAASALGHGQGHAVWVKREWRCRPCGRSWRETSELIRPRAVVTELAHTQISPGASIDTPAPRRHQQGAR